MTAPFNSQPISVPVAEQIAAQLRLNANMLYEQMVFQYTTAYDSVWNNPDATPDAIVAAMGTDAIKLFTLSGGLAAYLTAAGANVVTTMPANWNFQANPDGSVVLTPVTPG